MTDLGPYLERLGLEQYLDAFVGEGFDTWETLLDIQESDFDALNVKLGHRRKLQRAIADHRGISYERIVGVTSYEGPSESTKTSEGHQAHINTLSSGGSAAPEAKRKYRRHPKPDENAPERPPSAYVIFSNQIRNEVRGDNLSFTEIAKLVGDRWQKLDAEGKEPYESQANAAKERYNIQSSAYKKTEAYKDYMQYLAEFKTKHGAQTEPKRPRLEPESSGGSLSTKSLENPSEMLAPTQGHIRGGSMGSVSSSSYSALVPSPAGLQGPPMPVQFNPGIGSFPARQNTSSSSRGGSPSASQQGREVKRLGQLSSHSSMSDESSAVRSESETLMRAAGLSLSTPPSGTPPLPAILSSGSGSEFGATPEALARSRFGASSQSSGIASFSTSSSSVTPHQQPAYSPPPPDSSWRTRPVEHRGYADMSRALQPSLPYSISLPHGSTALPPLVHPERLAELSQGPNLRTLPLPRVSPTGQQPGTMQPGRSSDTSRPIGHDIMRRQQLPGLGNAPPTLERSESDAADALADLAARDSGQGRSYSNPHPSKQ